MSPGDTSQKSNTNFSVETQNDADLRVIEEK